MRILLGLVVVAVVVLALVWVGGLVLDYFSADKRAVRSSSKASKAELLHTRRQLHSAKSALIKIAANDSGNPILDAQIALEEIQRSELNELEK